MEFVTGSMRSKLKILFSKDFARWKTMIENLIMLTDPDLWIFITEPYEKPSLKGVITSDDRERYHKDKRVHEIITTCLPQDIFSCYKNQATAYNLWEALLIGFDKESKGSDEGIKRKLLKKRKKIQALKSQVLNMENEREEMRLTIIGLEKKVAEFEDHQTAMNKLQVDYDVAITMVEALREQCDEASQSHIPPVKEKKKKKIYTDKSSEPLVRMVRTKKMSQFTTYSLQKNKNKKYSENFPSTKQQVHRTVDSCVYTRAQMFALAPPQCNNMVQRRRKDFVPFSPRNCWLPPVPRTEFRHETTRFNFRWNSISLDYLDESYKRLSKISRKIGTVLKWVPKAVV